MSQTSCTWRNPAAFTIQCDRKTARVVVLPVPYDGTTSWRGGAREGPRAIIEASRYLELYDEELDRQTHQVGIHTLTELEPDLSGPEAVIEQVRSATDEILAAGKLPVTLGGEHSLTLGAVKACLQKYPALSVLHLDAHSDLRDMLCGTRFSHGTVMRRVHELCPITQVGIRSLSLEERDYIRAKGIKPFFADGLEINETTIGTIATGLTERVYISLDVDVLDPSVIPATGTPEPGGLHWYELLRLLRGVARARQIIGFDVVELSPDFSSAASNFTIAKLVYKMIGYITF